MSDPRPETPETPASTPSEFQTTRWSLVLRAGRGGSREAGAALEQLCRDYWRPLHAYVLRRGHCRDDAHDLTQEFVARLLEAGSFGTVDPAKGKFRSFLLASLKNFLAKEWARGQRQKRGGALRKISLSAADDDGLNRLEPFHELTPEKEFERRWAQAILEAAFQKLRAEFVSAGRGDLFESLEGFLSAEGGSLSYDAIAARLGKTEGAVKVAVHRLRQRYADRIREEVLGTVASPDEVDEEIHDLMSALAGGDGRARPAPD